MAYFFQNVNALMKHYGYRAKDVEALTGINHTAITSYQNRRYIPNSVNLCKLAGCFNVSMDKLWGDGR